MRSLFVLAMLGAQGAVAAENEPPQMTPEVRQRAEDLAGAASQRFTDILDKGTRADATQVAGSKADGDQAPATGTFAPVWNWLYTAQKSYDDLVIAQLKNPNGWTVIVQKSGEAASSAAASAPPAEVEPTPELKGWSGLVEMVRNWLARANRSYRNEIVAPLREPVPTDAPSELAKESPPTAQPGDEIKRAAEEEAQARSRSLAAKRAAEEDEARRRAERDAEAKQKADAEAAKRSTDEAEAKRVAELKAAIEKRRADEEKRRADAAEAERKAEAESRAREIEAAAEARRQADEDARVARQAEAKRAAEAEARRVAEAEAKRRDEEAKRQAAEADAAERKAVAEAEAESKRKAEIEAEATRRSQEAAKAKEAEREKRAAEAKETVRADVTPAPAASPPPKSEAASAPKSPAAAPASSPPAVAAQENSNVAGSGSDAAPKEKPALPESKREATPKAREESAIADATPPASVKKKSLKRTATKWRGKKKHARAYGQRKHRSYKRRWASPEGAAVERRCACRCGAIYSRPRKHKRIIWGEYRPARVYAKRPYRVRGDKRHRARLIYRSRGHYIR
jgi:hypothetical protein